MATGTVVGLVATPFAITRRVLPNMHIVAAGRAELLLDMDAKAEVRGDARQDIHIADALHRPLAVVLLEDRGVDSCAPGLAVGRNGDGAGDAPGFGLTGCCARLVHDSTPISRVQAGRCSSHRPAVFVCYASDTHTSHFVRSRTFSARSRRASASAREATCTAGPISIPVSISLITTSYF